MLQDLTTKLAAKLMTVKSQKGVTMIEYALIASLVAVVAIAGVKLVGTDVLAVFNNVAANL